MDVNRLIPGTTTGEQSSSILAELARLREIIADNERDARWIVGQFQRVPDEPIKEVALAIVDRSRAMSSHSQPE